ncbi:S24 family peptidase [Paraburkholderia sp. JPY303]|uniref:LexA family protein n=1 Tax=Paraburkholderia atlantica TaxID=2654982 RepID=UPI00159007D4|nr:S24 family peptidase [Paraburkholderia atlantica]NUY35956.1 S24 family peptidase [Paraburkholderia atlantica]
MRYVGLPGGDLVVVEKNPPLKPGDIAFSLIDGEITVKTLRLDTSCAFYLEPANPDLHPIRPQGSLVIAGMVTSSVPSMESRRSTVLFLLLSAAKPRLPS